MLGVADDPDLRRLAVALLGNLGYQIMEAATGPAVLEQLGSATGVNLLLTDVVLVAPRNSIRTLITRILCPRVGGGEHIRWQDRGILR